MRITMLLLTATGLLMGCGSKRIASSTPAQPAADAAAVSEKKPAPVEKKAEKTAAKSEKKAEKASEKAVKASEKTNDKAKKANDKSEKAAEKKAEKPAEKKAEKAADKNAEKASDKADKAVEKKSEKPAAAASSPRKLTVPPGHYPLPGECRVWFPGRPPGQQPRATVCKNLVGKVPAGAFLLYNDKHYDADYDWAAHAQRESWSVPRTVVQVLSGGR